MKRLMGRRVVHGVSRAALWLFAFSLRMALKIFVIPTRYNCVYSLRHILKALTYLSLWKPDSFKINL